MRSVTVFKFGDYWKEELDIFLDELSRYFLILKRVFSCVCPFTVDFLIAYFYCCSESWLFSSFYWGWTNSWTVCSIWFLFSKENSEIGQVHESSVTSSADSIVEIASWLIIYTWTLVVIFSSPSYLWQVMESSRSFSSLVSGFLSYTFLLRLIESLWLRRWFKLKL